MRLITFIFALLFLGLISFSTPVNKEILGVSGRYEYLDVALDADNQVITGYFEDHTGWDERIKAPRFSCEFFLFGKKDDNGYRITTWYPGYDEFIRGEFRFVKVNGILNAFIKLQEQHGGCDNVYVFDPEKGDLFELKSEEQWIEIRVISAEKAYFFSEPKSTFKQKSFVIRNDVIQIFVKKGGWVLAQFSGEKKVKGWIRESDLFSIRTAMGHLPKD